MEWLLERYRRRLAFISTDYYLNISEGTAKHTNYGRADINLLIFSSAIEVHFPLALITFNFSSMASQMQIEVN